MKNIIKILVEKNILLIIYSVVFFSIMVYTSPRVNLAWYDEPYYASGALSWMKYNDFTHTLTASSANEISYVEVFSVPYFIIVGSFYKLVGFSRINHRIINILFLFLTYICVYYLAKKFTQKKWVAQITAVIFTLLPNYSYLIYSGRPESFTGFVTILFILLVINHQNNLLKSPLKLFFLSLFATSITFVHIYPMPFSLIFYLLLLFDIYNYRYTTNLFRSVILPVVGGSLIGLLIMLIPFFTDPQLITNTVKKLFTQNSAGGITKMSSHSKLYIIYQLIKNNPGTYVLSFAGLSILVSKKRNNLIILSSIILYLFLLIGFVSDFHYTHRTYFIFLFLQPLGTVALLNYFSDKKILYQIIPVVLVILIYKPVHKTLYSAYSAHKTSHVQMYKDIIKSLQKELPDSCTVASTLSLFFDLEQLGYKTFAYFGNGTPTQYFNTLLENNVEYIIMPHNKKFYNYPEKCYKKMIYVDTYGDQSIAKQIPIYRGRQLLFDLYRIKQ